MKDFLAVFITYSRDVDGNCTISFELCEQGGYTAFIPELPGAISEGETIEEARSMVLDALHDLTDYRRREALKQASKTAIVVSLKQTA